MKSFLYYLVGILLIGFAVLWDLGAFYLSLYYCVHFHWSAGMAMFALWATLCIRNGCFFPYLDKERRNYMWSRLANQFWPKNPENDLDKDQESD